MANIGKKTVVLERAENEISPTNLENKDYILCAYLLTEKNRSRDQKSYSIGVF